MDLPYYVAFSVFPGIGPVRFRLLLEYFGTAQKAWEATTKELREVHVPNRLLTEFVEFRKTCNIDAYIRQVETKNIRVLPITDPRYPARLKEIRDAPFLLYIYGQAPLSLLNQSRMIAVVGTRSITPYGKDVTRRITRELVSRGFVIVSGLALGVDGVAHEAAIASQGQTIAVLGCGVDIIAPASHASLYYDIAKNGGLVISEMPIGHQPLRGLFPARNRIISGLSLGVIVTEGAEDSGALITARNAAEQGREVFAVPGPITSEYSRGPAKLLKNGATLVETVDDILQELDVPKTIQKDRSIHSYPERSPTEQTILACIAHAPTSTDAIVQTTGIDTMSVLSALTALELSGYIEQTGEGAYVLTNG